jgi:quercetin dioxygenase-like cupin family protein
MPEDATGPSGAERVNRCRTAERIAIGPRTRCVDFFNQELTPGIRMSGGLGFFEPGGRLPAHVHDFDESIAIVGGEATCLVEGREYRLSDNATAMVPRGRVHCFINQTKEPMVMIWVYAGGMPERLVVHERCATLEGDPWKQTTAPQTEAEGE